VGVGGPIPAYFFIVNFKKMNPEKLYPELMTLKPREIFVEWVMVTKNLVVLEKIHYKKTIREQEQSTLRRELKEKYGNEIEMITIFKDTDVEEVLITLY